MRSFRTAPNMTPDATDIMTDNSIPTTNAVITVEVATCTDSTGTPPTWGSFSTQTSGTFAPLPYDLISVKVSVPASDVSWFNPYFLNNLNITSSTVVMMRAGKG